MWEGTHVAKASSPFSCLTRLDERLLVVAGDSRIWLGPGLVLLREVSASVYPLPTSASVLEVQVDLSQAGLRAVRSRVVGLLPELLATLAVAAELCPLLSAPRSSGSRTIGDPCTVCRSRGRQYAVFAPLKFAKSVTPAFVG